MPRDDEARPAHTRRAPQTSPHQDDQRPPYARRVPDERAEFAARRAAAMPLRHAQRLRNLAASGDARQRLADNPVFAPLFSDRQGGGRDE